MPPITFHEKRVFKNRGVVITLSQTYGDLERQSLDSVEALWPHYPKAHRFWQVLIEDRECQANWDMADYLSVKKLNYNDHGRTHAVIAAANAVIIYDLLVKSHATPDVVSSGAGDADDACLVVAAAALLHDIGNQVHRKYHELVGTTLALPVLDRLMPELYPDIEQRVEIRAFILHAILAHDFDPPPLTFEAGVVAIADGSDITKGRGRIAFDLGKADIHSVSALAIDEVHIRPGTEVPVVIEVVMNNSAGIFQIDETLTRKIVRGPLNKLVTVTAITRPEDSSNDMRIVNRLTLKNGVFVAE